MARTKQTARKSSEPLHRRRVTNTGRGPTTPGTLSELAESTRPPRRCVYSKIPYEGSIFQKVFLVHTVSFFPSTNEL